MNPAVSGPNSGVVREALQKLDWAVVVDLYETETAAQAKSPFPVIGLIVAIMGLGMTVVAFAVKIMYAEPGWFGLNLLAGGILVAVGLLLRFFSGKGRALS